MKKILELINMDKLDESKQTEIKEKLESIIDLKVNEKLVEKEVILKEELTTVFEDKFETYKEDITEKFSNFVDEILEKELVLDEKVIEYARKGELYSDLIEQFKTRLAIDENQITDEVKDILREARDEINSLKETVDEQIGKNLTLESEANTSKIKLYLLEKVQGLPLDEADKVLSLLESESDTESIDKKFKTITESGLLEKKKVDDDDDDKDDEDEEDEDDEDEKKKDKKKKKVDESNSLMNLWVNTMKKENI